MGANTFWDSIRLTNMNKFVSRNILNENAKWKFYHHFYYLSIFYQQGPLQVKSMILKAVKEVDWEVMIK